MGRGSRRALIISTLNVRLRSTGLRWGMNMKVVFRTFLGHPGKPRASIAGTTAGPGSRLRRLHGPLALVVVLGTKLSSTSCGAAEGEPPATVPSRAAAAHHDEPAATNSVAAAITGEYGTDGLRMNFHGAPLNLVLNYLSDAAGFVINKQTDIRGSVEVWSKQPITKDEAIELLSSVLKKNGYALTRNGRILTIVGSDSVKTADTEIVVSSNPDDVEKSDEVQTQIIPVRYANVTQLVQNLQLLLPTSATLSANESANTLIAVATRTDIKRILRIVSALDNSMTSATTMKVLPLRHSDAKETANLITQLYSQQNSSQPPTGQGNPNFGGPGGGPFGGFPPGMGQGQASSGSSSTGRGSLAGRVVAVADDRSNSVVLSATPDLLAGITDMVNKLDQPFSDLTELRVFRLANAEPSELADQLAQLFPDETASGNNQNNNMPFFFPGGGGPPGAANNTTATSSERAKKMGKVLAVPDPRTSCLIVTAAKTLMPQIAAMITQLDSEAGKREVVSYFELRNADPQDIYQNLQDLFNRSTVRAQSDSQNSFLGRNNPLTQRETQNQQSTGASSTTTSGLGAQTGGGARPGQ